MAECTVPIVLAPNSANCKVWWRRDDGLYAVWARGLGCSEGKP
uniref:Uncharacterized protein n=1 Tax=Anguilla anguilla TaxID=7936 RepID=A0A0E9VJT3_ANGAN